MILHDPWKAKQFIVIKEPIQYLGIYTDEGLTWKSHIMKVSATIYRAIFCINRLKNILPEGSLKSLYYSLVHSHLTYGIQIWGASASVSKLENLQKIIIRVIKNKQYISQTQNLFNGCKMLKSKDMLKYQVALMIHD